MAENKNLTAAQMRFLVALLEERTIEAACRKTDTPRRTGDRWRTLPQFRAELDRRQSDVLDELAARMLASLPHVETFLIATMADRAQPIGARLRAAGEYKDMTLRLFEQRNIERRLSALEGVAGEL